MCVYSQWLMCYYPNFMLHVFYNDEFTPKYPIWIPLLGQGYKLVNKNRQTHPNGVKNLLTTMPNPTIY